MPDAEKKIQNPLSARQLTLLIASIVAGILFAQFVAPQVFKAMPTDLVRNKYLLDVLASPEHQPEYVVLGNSIAMQGIDTRIISNQISGDPLGYNLSTTGQGLTESNLFFTALPDSVNTIVHVLYAKQLNSVTVINEQKYNAMYMNGVRIDDELRRNLIGFYGKNAYGSNASDLLNKTHVEQMFESRWAIRQSLDTIIRNYLRKDLQMDKVATDLFFPSPQPEPLTEKKLLKNLADTYSTIDPNSDFWLSTMAIPHLRNFIQQVTASGRRYIMVVAPLNPRSNKYNPADRIEATTRATQEIIHENGGILIDAIQLLDAKDFADALHPTPEGAEMLSRYIGQQIATEVPDFAQRPDGSQ